MRCERLWHNARLATMAADRPGMGLVGRGLVASAAGRIVYAGPAAAAGLVPMAVATDCNPGTSPLTSILLAMNMAATLFRLSVEECLLGVTRQAARALDWANETGALERGKSCDLAIWDIERPAELVYRIGAPPLHARVWRGR